VREPAILTGARIGDFMFNVITLLLTVVATVALVFAAIRAFGARNRAVRWIGTGIASLFAALACVLCVLLGNGLTRQIERSAPVPQLQVDTSPERIARGKAISDGFCSGCHSTKGTLTGGLDIATHIPLPIGRLIVANLTPAGALKTWSDGEIFRAIRNSIDADGNWMTIMSYTNAGHLSDDDIKAVIAYLRNVPEAGAATPTPPDALNPLGITMLGAGLLPTGNPVMHDVITAPPKGPTPAYGAYILSYQDCRGCHGKDLSGGVAGQMAPIGPGLGMIKGWTLQNFVSTMRTGIDPGGYQLDDDKMPWRAIGKMGDDELAAIYNYLVELPGL
jgi:mono/diheme cytochrome c family protein